MTPIKKIGSGGLLLLGVLVGLVGCERASGTITTSPEVKRPSTGFADYDWLPEKLKHTMDHLAHLYPDRHFSFYYYFATEDINRNFYMTDPGLRVIAEMPVTNEEAMNRIDEKLYNVKVRKHGLYVAQDTVNRYQQAQVSEPWPVHKSLILYVLPEDSADFYQLRVAIVKDTISRQAARNPTSNDLTIYDIDEVDIPPRPVRGMKYFREAVTKAVQSAKLFTLYDTGTVEVEFTVWHTAGSPNIIHGFNSQEDTYEAYQADSEVLKAIHFAKVWWHNAQKDGQPVRSNLRMTFDIRTLKNSAY